MPHAQSAVHTAHRWLSLKGRATCGPFGRDSTVLPWPPTGVPKPAGQQGCNMYPNNCYRLQADAMRGCELDQIARCANGAARSRHWRRLSGATSYAHSTNRSMACRLTSRREWAGRGRPKLESRAHISGRALTIRNMPNSAIPLGAQCRPMPNRDRCQLVVAWLWLVYAESLAPMRLMGWRGRMRRIGATCTAAKTHARLQGMPA